MSRARLSGPSADRKVYDKATQVLERFDRGVRCWRRTLGKGFYVIDVSRTWRLLSKDEGRSWRLMTHETYNNHLGRK